jgi:transcription initiation factor TFIIF subunit alpha
VQRTEQDITERRKQNGGWLDPPPPGCSDIPIMTTKKALLDGIRHHMLKFASKPGEAVDPTDQDEFARPVTLHRRDPRQPPPGRAVKEEPIPEPEPKSVDQEEQERLAQIKADKEAQRAIDQAKIAPVIKDNQPKKPKKAKEDKITFNRAPKTEAAKKESEIRYEEALPWHLEDADGKNVWVGSYVSALSETTVALMIDGGVFRMVPIEKWYKMASKPPFEAYSIEKVESIMGKKTLESRWAKRDKERREAEGDMEFTRRMFYGKGPMIKTESDTFKAASRSEKLDHDDLDVSGDEFQDDDEQPTLERQDDEDTKETNERIKREQREANNFGEGDEQELEKELKAQLKEQLDRQKYGKKLKKKLLKNQDNVYDESDSDEKPWTSSVSALQMCSPRA